MQFCRGFPYSHTNDALQESAVIVCLSFYIPTSYLTILSLAAIAGGLYLLVAGFHLLARKHSLLAPRSSKIGDASPGLVEISGMAAGLHTITAPISGESCFLYRTTAWQQGKSKRQNWEKVAEENLYLPFLINDSTGQLLIEPPGAELDLLRNFREEYEASFFSSDVSSKGENNEDSNNKKDEGEKNNAVPLRVRAFLSRHEIIPVRRLRVEECSIKPQDVLFVAGTLLENRRAKERRSSSHDNASHDNTLHDGARRNCSPLGPTPNELAEPLPAPQIVRLAAGAAAAAGSSHMTQQAKIAAALTRAGVAQPEAWSGTEVLHQKLAVADNAHAVTPLAHAAVPPATTAQENEALKLKNEAPANELETYKTESTSESSDVSLQDVRLQEVRVQEVRVRETSSLKDAAFSAFNLAPPIVLTKGANDPTFRISFRSQKEFSSELAWKSSAMLGGGAAMTLAGVCGLLARLIL
jgi:hypothetical protein